MSAIEPSVGNVFWLQLYCAFFLGRMFPWRSRYTESHLGPIKRETISQCGRVRAVIRGKLCLGNEGCGMTGAFHSSLKFYEGSSVWWPENSGDTWVLTNADSLREAVAGKRTPLF